MTIGKVFVVSCLSKYIQPSLGVKNDLANITKGNRLKRMIILQREMKKIRGKEIEKNDNSAERDEENQR